jgi:hypothetical protein
MYYVVAKKTVHMDDNDVALIKGKRYPIKKEAAGYVFIDSESRRDHRWGNVNGFFHRVYVVKVLRRTTKPNSKYEIGHEYRIIKETDREYTIETEEGHTASFTKEPDGVGFSYKDWFELAEYTIKL